VEKRLDGGAVWREVLAREAVRSGREKGTRAAKAKSSSKGHRRQRRRNWSKNFDLKKAPKIWQAAQNSGYRQQGEQTNVDGHMPAIMRKWRKGKSSPDTGKLSARPAGKPGYSFASFTGTRNLTRDSTSPGKRGHFYFASRGTFLLCLDRIQPTLTRSIDCVYAFGRLSGAALDDAERMVAKAETVPEDGRWPEFASRG
jgi:hypothetical protein